MHFDIHLFGLDIFNSNIQIIHENATAAARTENFLRYQSRGRQGRAAD